MTQPHGMGLIVVPSGVQHIGGSRLSLTSNLVSDGIPEHISMSLHPSPFHTGTLTRFMQHMHPRVDQEDLLGDVVVPLDRSCRVLGVIYQFDVMPTVIPNTIDKRMTQGI